MPETLTLTASDGHSFNAYMAEPEGKPLGAVVVIQEVFGVNVHIRDVTERWAAVGYKAIAPALYDRFEPGFEVGYEPDDIARGREFKAKANEVLDKVILDVEAARAAVSPAGKIGITGFCWGGFVAYVAACRLNFQAAAGYYGGGIADMLDEKPKCPTILHFGDSDASIPMEDVEKIRAANTGAEIFVYQAGHGFHCDMRGSFDPRAANIAAMRTTQLFERNLR